MSTFYIKCSKCGANIEIEFEPKINYGEFGHDNYCSCPECRGNYYDNILCDSCRG